MPHLAETYEYAKLASYPHMKPADTEIWNRFITRYPNAYKTCQYDVWVGSEPPFDTVVNPETGGDDVGLYKRKIDVVGHDDDTIDIIELKPRAGTSALGQVRGYMRLYARDHRPTKKLRAVLITDKIATDMAELAAAENVILLAV